MSTAEIFDEINELSAEGVEYPELIDFGFILLERIDAIPESLLVNTIDSRLIHPNLRILCVELLETKYMESLGDIELSERSVEKLSAIVADAEENASVRRRLIETLPRTEATAEILAKTAYDSEPTIAYRSLQFLNFFAPEVSRSIAVEFIKSGENVSTGVDTINYQMARTDNTAEKDEWVAYLVDSLEKNNSESASTQEKPDLSDNTIFSCLTNMRYHKALYEIINSPYIDEEDKESCLGSYHLCVEVLKEVLENEPTQYDIEMIKKAIEIELSISETLLFPLKLAEEELMSNSDTANQ